MEPPVTAPTALSAHARITTHEAVCAERYEGLQTSLDAMSGRIGRMEGLILGVAGALICGMAMLIITLMLRLPVPVPVIR